MAINGIIPGVLFIAGIAAIFASSGGTLLMLAGDALIALAGISFVKFAK